MSIENKFYQGFFAEIISHKKLLTVDDQVFLIASYCLTGQVQEAEDIFLTMKFYDSRSLFFLIIGWTRQSQYKKSREYLKRLHLECKTDFDNFLFSQAMGFFNYFICRYKQSEKWLVKTKVFLKKDKYHSFWEMLYLDLASHVFVKRGRINLGLQYGYDSLKVARQIGNKFSAEATEVSISIYESLYGLDQQKSLKYITRLIAKYKTRKNFYYFNLSLEYVRRLNLSGQLEASEKVLRSIQKSIFISQLNRQKAVWGFRWAHLLFLQGKYEQSLNQLESSLEYLDANQDISLQIQILGLRLKILTLLKREDLELIEKIKKLTFYCQDSQALSYAYRYGWISKPLTEDPYAQFFHDWKRQGHKNYNTLKRVADSGWISLFVDLIPLERQQFVYLDFLPKQALIFSDRGIKILNGLTPLIHQALLILSKGPISKKGFVELLWGYEYDFLRHDTLVYSVVGRIREFLQEYADLLVMKDHVIEFIQSQVRVYEHENKAIAYDGGFEEHIEWQHKLNYRQIEILEYLVKTKYVDAIQISKILHISRITAFRDLDQLVKQNKICRLGKGRATRYTLETN